MPSDRKAKGEQDWRGQLYNAYTHLRDAHGWREPTYAKKDPAIALDLIEAGSTGIHRGYRDEHGFWVADEMDTWPSYPVLWRLHAD